MVFRCGGPDCWAGACWMWWECGRSRVGRLDRGSTSGGWKCRKRNTYLIKYRHEWYVVGRVIGHFYWTRSSAIVLGHNTYYY